MASEGSGLESLETVEETSVTQYKVDDLAEQLTIISHAIFRDLLPLDLASLNWYNPKLRNSPDSQRVNAITSRFNYDGQWAITEILKQEVPDCESLQYTTYVTYTDLLPSLIKL